MGIDMLAGLGAPMASVAVAVPTVLVFDSGVGGLSVLAALREAMPGARFVYTADDAAFPYGALADEALVARVRAVILAAVARHAPDIVVIACHTASTLVLPVLRAELKIPVVGTVPAIKPAAQISQTRRIAVLATPGTIRRSYTRELVMRFAADCTVHLVGAARLAGLAEAALRGEPADDAEIAAEIEPCFVAADGRPTDTVVLACTHFPLLGARLARLSPWPVTFVDPAPAIARRALSLLPGPPVPAAREPVHRAVFTGGRNLSPELVRALAGYALAEIAVEPVA